MDELRAALEALAESWETDAEFLEDGDEVHNRPRVVLRSRKATPREVGAAAARGCADQLRAVLAAHETHATHATLLLDVVDAAREWREAVKALIGIRVALNTPEAEAIIHRHFAAGNALSAAVAALDAATK